AGSSAVPPALNLVLEAAAGREQAHLITYTNPLAAPTTTTHAPDTGQRYDRDHSGQIEFNEFLLMFRDQMLSLKIGSN
ncbi:uncharacterized protein HaLaN_10430, partial [Haematococcus lacustris]